MLCDDFVGRTEVLPDVQDHVLEIIELAFAQDWELILLAVACQAKGLQILHRVVGAITVFVIDSDWPAPLRFVLFIGH